MSKSVRHMGFNQHSESFSRQWSISLFILFFAWSIPAVAAANDDSGCDPSLHHRLLERLDALEQQVSELRGKLANRPEAFTPESPAPESVIADQPDLDPPSSDDGATEQSDLQTFHQRTVYLPSRGRLGAWRGELGEDFALRTFIDLEFIDSGQDGTRGGDSTFDTHHVQLFLDSQLRPNLSAHAELEWEHSGDQLEVDQAYLSWAIRDSLSLDIGRFYAPFGIERFTWYSPTATLVSRPEAFRQIVPGNFYANGVRFSGALLGGDDGKLLSYEVSVSNGLGDSAASNRRGSRQNRDNNSAKAMTGRLGLALSRFFEVGASYHGEEYSSEGGLGLEFIGADVAFRRAGFEFRGEWVDATIERAATVDLEQQGFYGQLSYSIVTDRDLMPEILLAVRYDDSDLDRSLRGNDDRQKWSIGLNAAIYDHFRLKAEYRFESEDGPERDDDTLFLQAVIDF